MAKAKPDKSGEQWKEAFSKATFRTSFTLSLSQAMIEFLCATADGVRWDRAMASCQFKPDNWLSTENSLAKRGLIRRKPPQVLKEEGLAKMEKASCCEEFYAYSFCELTPAGEAVVELFKVTGIFVAADAAGFKKKA